jgi:hypothetical protein
MSSMSQYYLHVQELVETGDLSPAMIEQIMKAYGISQVFVEQTIKVIKERQNVA